MNAPVVEDYSVPARGQTVLTLGEARGMAYATPLPIPEGLNGVLREIHLVKASHPCSWGDKAIKPKDMSQNHKYPVSCIRLTA